VFYLRLLFLSIIAMLLGLYIPIFALVVISPDSDIGYETLLPYCMISSVLFLFLYLWFERKNITKKLRGRKNNRS